MKIINKKSKLIAIVITLIIIMLLIIVGVINKEKIMQIIPFQSLLGEEEEDADEQELLSYKIYDNEDVNNIKLSFTIQSNDGIEYIEDFTNNKIFGYGKSKIVIDYTCALGTELQFKIKEINKDEVEEKIEIVPELGTQEYPFLIKNAKGLKNIANHYLEQKILLETSNIYYKLDKDIDLQNANWTAIGNSATTAFGGYLDGNNHKISNINVEKTSEKQGLFGHLTGQVSNLNLENVKVSGTNYIGALAGYSTGTITNCSATNIEITGTGNYIGGLVGDTTAVLKNNTVSGTITTSGDNSGGIVGHSTAVVSDNTANISINGKANVGGIVGNTTNAVNNNAAEGTIIATGNNIGGIIGYTTSNASGDHFNGNITGVTNVGGIIGYSYVNTYTTNITLSYCIGNVTGTSNVGGICGNMYMNENWDRYEGTNINKCFIDGNIYATNQMAGGIVGYGEIRSTNGGNHKSRL